MENKNIPKFRRYDRLFKYWDFRLLIILLLSLLISLSVFFYFKPSAASRARKIRPAVVKKYGEQKAKAYLGWYKAGYREQIEAGEYAFPCILIEGGENWWKEEAYNRGTMDAREDMGMTK